MSQVLATPGVYIEEKSAFPSSAVQVATAIPAFIGYTEKAIRDNKSLKNKPTRITSLSEFHQFFGAAPKTTFSVAEDEETGFKVEVDTATKFNLYRGMRMFFANGGSTCYIVSAGNYGNGVSAKDLNDAATESGIPTLLKFPEPTMLVIPDAVLLEEADCSSLQQAMLMHCGKDTKSRIALLDVFNGDQSRTYDDKDVIVKSREGYGNNFLQWGAAYYPYLNTTIVQGDEVDFSNISNLDALTPLLDAEADAIYGDDAKIIKDEVAKLTGDNDPVNLHQTLMAKLPLYKAVLA
ncbi:MAG: phage tail sheath protein FI, partial [Arcticibacterium sp.]